MSNRAYAFMAGLFVLVLAAALVGGAIWLGGYQVPRRPYIVVSKGVVSGLNAQSTVYYRGVAAGVVDTIKFDPNNIRNILVRIEVNQDVPLTHGTYATLRPQGVTGLSHIELNDKGQNTEPLKTSPEHPARIPMHASLLHSLSSQGQQLLGQIDKLTKRLNQVLRPENRQRVDQILAAVQTAMEQLTQLEAQANTSFQRLPALAERMNKTLSNINALVANISKTSKEVRQAAVSVDQFSQSGRHMSQTAQHTTLPRLNQLLGQLQDTTQEVHRLTKSLQQNPQALLFGQRPPPPGPGEPGYTAP